MRRRSPSWAMIAVGIALGAWSAPALAQAPPHPVVILGEGGGADDLATRIGYRLSAPFVARDPAPLRRSLAASHAPTLAAAAAQTAKDAKLVGRVGASLRAAHAHAAVLLHEHTSKRGISVHVWLIEAGARDAAVDHELTLPPHTSATEEAEAVWTLLEPDLTTHEAPAPESAPAPPKPPEPAKVVPAPSPEPAPSPVTPPPPVAPEPFAQAEKPSTNIPSSRDNAVLLPHVSVGVGTRHFNYVDRVTPSLRDYDLTAAPLVAVDAEVYPLVGTHLPVLRDLGITGDCQRAFALSSTDSGGASVGTGWSSFDVGIRERLHVAPPLVLSLHAGYGQNDFTFDGAASGTARLPEVKYGLVHEGVDADLALAGFTLSASASYAEVLSTGLVGTYFPRASVGGIDASLGVSHRIAGRFELALRITHARFFYSMKPEPGDANVAGGALDQMGSALLGVGYVL